MVGTIDGDKKNWALLFLKFLYRSRTVFLFFSVPVFYLVGFGYYEGYLSAYGMSRDLFPLQIYDAYVYCYFYVLVNFTNLMGPVNYIMGGLFDDGYSVLLILFFNMIFVFYLLKSSGFKYKEFVSGFTKLNRPPSLDDSDMLDSIHDASYVITISLSSLLFISLVYLGFALVLKFPYESSFYTYSASAAGIAEKGCQRSEKSPWPECVDIFSDNKLLYSGKLIAQHNGYIGLFTKEGAIVLKFPDKGRIVRRPDKAALAKLIDES